MTLRIPIAAFVTSTLLVFMPAMAEDIDMSEAEGLLNQNCTQCHGSDVYLRADRRVQSLDGLHSQVRMCEQNLGLTWFDDQVNGVASLLNQRYYKFDD